MRTWAALSACVVFAAHMDHETYESAFRPTGSSASGFAERTRSYHSELEASNATGVWVVALDSATYRSSDACVSKRMREASRGSALRGATVLRKYAGTAASARAVENDCAGVAAVHPVAPEFKYSRSRVVDYTDVELVVEFEPSSWQSVVTLLEDWYGEYIGGSPWVNKVMDVGSRALIMRKVPVDSVDELMSYAAICDGVTSVESVGPPTKSNDQVRWVVQSNDRVTEATPLYDLGLTGDGVIINVNEDGLDTFSCFFRDDDVEIDPNDFEELDATAQFFGDATISGMPSYSSEEHRKIRYAIWPFYDPIFNPDEWAFNPGLHGSHVAGSALGSSPDFRLSFGPTVNYTGDGLAPDAKIALFDFSPASDELFSIYPPVEYDVVPLQATYDVGARVSTNSWGSPSGDYIFYASAVDSFAFEHQDVLVLFSSGNSGPDLYTMGTPAIAKNTLAVGYTDTYPQATGLDAILSSRRTDAPSSGPTAAPTVTAAPTMFTFAPVSLTTFTEDAFCVTDGCSASLVFDFPPFFGSAILDINAGGDLDSTSGTEFIDIFVNGENVGRCGGFSVPSPRCIDPLQVCLQEIDVSAAAATGSIEVSFEASPSVSNRCPYDGISNIAAVIEATLTIAPPGPVPTPSPSGLTVRTFTATDSCSESGCSRSLTFDLHDQIDSASLSLVVGGDLDNNAFDDDFDELLEIFVNGVSVGECGFFDVACNDPLLPCLGTIDVTEAARTGQVVVTYAATPAVSSLCVYNSATQIAAIVEATLVVQISDTSLPTTEPTVTFAPTPAPTPSPSSPAPVPVPTSDVVAGVGPLTASSLCRTTGCRGTLFFIVPESGFAIESASLDLVAGGDLGSTALGEQLTIFVNGESVGTCGGFLIDCNDDLLPCVTGVDVTHAALTGVIEVTYDATNGVDNFCTYQGFFDVAAIVEGSVTVQFSDTAIPTPGPTTSRPSATPAPSVTEAPTAPPTELLPLVTVGESAVASLKGSNGVEFRVQVDVDTRVRISTCGSTIEDLALSLDLKSTEDGTLRRIAFNDDCYCCSDVVNGLLQASLELDLQASRVYIATVVSPQLGQAGEVTLSVFASPEPANAVSLPDLNFGSSRGPVNADNRIKPDVVAPGANVYSAAAYDVAPMVETCDVRPETGSSMSTPVIAGVVALLVQYFEGGYYPTGVAGANQPVTPMGAALRALIIASSLYMTGTEANSGGSSTFPNFNQGFGFVLMSAVFNDHTTLFVDGDYNDMPTATAATNVFTYLFEVDAAAPSGDELRIVLCWHDPPSLTDATGRLLINDLDLVVEAADGSVTYPNFGSPSGDHINNVERIVISVTPGMTYTAVVTVASLVQGPQPFALVATGPFLQTAALFPSLFP